MEVQLVRRPGTSVDFTDPVASRAWIRQRVDEEIATKGQPLPRIYLLGLGFMEMLDLSAMERADPDADIGATFQILRRRTKVERCFLVLGGSGEGPDGEPHHVAIVFEERDAADGRRWWFGLREYATDPISGLGRPLRDWAHLTDETPNPAQLLPFLHPFASPPPGARPAVVRDAPEIWSPDIKFTWGELRPDVDLPTDAKQVLELALAMGVPNQLLTGELQGTLVLRLEGRAWELWVLDEDMPAPLVEMVRWIANHRLPAADCVAIANIVVRPRDDSPVPGLQMVAERDGMFAELWGPIVFGEPPEYAKSVPTLHWWSPRPMPEAARFLGMPSMAALLDGPPAD